MSSRYLAAAALLGTALLLAAAPLPPRGSPKAGPLGMTFVRLPRGMFFMGGDGEKYGVKTEIKDDFEIAIHTVTQEQWQALMGNNPSHFSRYGAGKDQVKDVADADLKQFPVENVSWDDAQQFIKKLNERERGNGYRYRLPTEAEWEYACRGGATSAEECSHLFYFARPTNDLSSDQANFDGNYPVGDALKGKYLQRTTKVGSYQPNKLGLYDMHGNVWQWCLDFHPQVASIRVFKGGGWHNNGHGCRAFHRAGGETAGQYNNVGFRLVRVPGR